MAGYTRSKRHPELFRPGRAKVWWAFVPNPEGGRKLRETTGHTDERAAHEWFLGRVRRDHGAVEAAGKEGKQRCLKDALSSRVDWLRSARVHNDPTRKKLSPDTIEFYVNKSKPLVNVLGPDTLLSDIGHEEIRKYITARSATAKATTIGKELTALSMAMRLARKDGIDCPVFKDIVPEDFAATYIPRTRWLTEPEVENVASVLAPKRKPLFLFLVCTGATYPSEVRSIRPAHVKGHIAHIPGTKATTRDRYVHVPSYGRRLLDLAVKGLGPSGFESWSNIRGDLHDAARLLSMCAPCRDARLAWARHEVGATRPRTDEDCKACERTPEFLPMSPNDLRRTFAQWLVRSGVPYELAAPMMGHNSTKMLEQVYGRRNAAAVAALVELSLKKAPKGARLATG